MPDDDRVPPESFGAENLFGFNGNVVMVTYESRNLGDTVHSVR